MDPLKTLLFKDLINILAHLNIILGMVNLIVIFVIADTSSLYRKFCSGQSCIYNLAPYIFILQNSLFLIIYGIGRFGYKKHINWLITVHHYMIFLNFGLSIFFVVYQVTSLEAVQKLVRDEACYQNQLLRDYRLVYGSAKEMFCNAYDDCACNPSSVLFTKQERSEFDINDTTGAVSVTQCNGYMENLGKDMFNNKSVEEQDQYLEKIVDMFEQMEENFNCSGFCTINSYYVFRDMNVGRTDNVDCKVELLDFMEKNCKVLVIHSSLICAFLTVHTIFSIYLIRNKDKVLGYFPQENVLSRNNRSQANINIGKQVNINLGKQVNQVQKQKQYFDIPKNAPQKKQKHLESIQEVQKQEQPMNSPESQQEKAFDSIQIQIRVEQDNQTIQQVEAVQPGQIRETKEEDEKTNEQSQEESQKLREREKSDNSKSIKDTSISQQKGVDGASAEQEQSLFVFTTNPFSYT